MAGLDDLMEPTELWSKAGRYARGFAENGVLLTVAGVLAVQTRVNTGTFLLIAPLSICMVANGLAGVPISWITVAAFSPSGSPGWSGSSGEQGGSSPPRRPVVNHAARE